MPRGVPGSGNRVRNRGSTATLEPAAASTSHQIKPLLGLTVQNYDFAVINGTYQAVMQQGQAWVPVASIPAFIVAQWFMQTGVLKPLGFASGTNGSANGSTGGSLPGGTARAGRGNRGETVRDQIITDKRV